MEQIKEGNNFLLSGGAGSGKTYSLVQTISQIIIDHPTEKIACITYTNSAAQEIEERIGHDNLIVSTYHDFIWDTIKHFKKELKDVLIYLVNNPDYKKISVPEEEIISDNYFDTLEDSIQYKEFARIHDGIISHDEVPVIAEQMYLKYPKIRRLLTDKYPFILVDEYQDTQPEIVRILLDHINDTSIKLVVGFFGDSMQCIYDKRTGNLDSYIAEGKISEIQKTQNRRSPKVLIDLANSLRTDGLIQTASDDIGAPNMKPDGTLKTGSIKFLYSKEDNIARVREYLGWDFSDSKNVKELNLTHNLIAGKAGFSSLMKIYDKDRILELKSRVKKRVKELNLNTQDLSFGEILKNPAMGDQTTPVIKAFLNEHKELFKYAKNLQWDVFSKMYIDKDQLIDDKKQSKEDAKKKGSKRDDLVKHLFRIEDAISAYRNGDYNHILRKTNFHITSIESKEKLHNAIIEISNSDTLSIGEVISLADSLGLVLIDDKLREFQISKEYIFHRISKVPYSNFKSLYSYLEGQTQFSTQHKVKGNEFNDVLVLMDNGNWNLYNFGAAFLGKYHNKNILNRSQKLLYTCFTRSKEKLAVFYADPSPDILRRAKELFNEEVINLDEL